MLPINIFHPRYLQSKFGKKKIQSMYITKKPLSKQEWTLRFLAHVHTKLWALKPSSNHHKPIFIVSNPRTGSNMLESVLVNTEEVFSCGEILNSYRLLSYEKASIRNLANLIRFFKTRTKKQLMAKIHLIDIQNSATDLGEVSHTFPDSSFIILYRENVLLQYISYLVALETNQWRKTRYSNNADEQKLQITIGLNDYTRFKDQQLQMYQQCYQSLKGRSIFIVSYEQLLNVQADNGIKNILDFLHLTNKHIKIKTKKQSKKSPKSYVANYKECIETLSKPEIYMSSTDFIPTTSH